MAEILEALVALLQLIAGQSANRPLALTGCLLPTLYDWPCLVYRPLSRGYELL